ncbi:NAD(P)H-binding protein [Marinomonas sp. THO17]|uniref:NmrA family NAD(P)-binding protein n=1 Tax=Marinomonas sp. THO17 TaxID=3149048 RepID=UPI00336BC5C5
MKSDMIAVIGAQGKTGTRVMARLKAKGMSTRGLSRHSEVVFDWANPSTWAPALSGVKAIYVTYYPDLAVPQATEDMTTFVEVAKQVGIEHLVLLSGRGEEGAQRAEQVVMKSGLKWNVVRASWFMQNFRESFMAQGIASGDLILPKPNAMEPFIDVEDIADVVVAALTQAHLQDQLLEVTGPELLSFATCVEKISKITGRTIGFTPVPVEAYLAGAKQQGLPDEMAWLIKELFVNVLDGRNESTTDTVRQVLGRPARNFDQYLAAQQDTSIWWEQGEP